MNVDSGKRHQYRKHKAMLLFIMITRLVAGSADVSAQTVPAPDYQVKAVFLFNFTQFVEWPQHAFAEVRSPVVVGVLGNDPFSTYLDKIVKGEQMNGHPLVIKRYRRVEEIESCHILFISQSEQYRLRRVLNKLQGRPILTVGDMAGFAEAGGMIQFYTNENKIRFQINLESVRSSALNISSKLLRLAEIVTP